MNKQQSGFSLIELVLVIVILGFLAATVLPKFADLSGQAEIAAADGVLGAANSATVINFSAGQAGIALAARPAGALITTGATLATALDGGLPTGWTTTGLFACNDTDASGTCTLAGDTYVITVTPETATARATLAKNW